jgi:NAD(P)-dependent dehydrogenase (short-subunit alcohol dehydrogenase family)
MNKTAIITGAYGAIGSGITEGMAKAGFDLILLGRDEKQLENLTAEIQNRHLTIKAQFNVVDLSRETEIVRFSDTIDGTIDVLINNAATCPHRRTETPEGIEMQFAANVLGYFWMMMYCSLKMKPGSRIVNVASYWAGGLDLTDVEFKRRPYNNDTAYRQSKQADRMLSTYFSTLLSTQGINVNACHPGDVNSKLSNDLGFGGHETPQQGAATPVWLATSKEAEHISGKYFEHKKAGLCSFSDDQVMLEQLFSYCLKYTRQKR